MSNGNNIKIFTAADIEKYHKGQLSAKEMHELEKAALDDPFLADALEGFATPGININEDIAELRRRLSENTERAKVIPIHTAGRSKFPWLRAAVAIVLVAGAGLLAYEFLYKAKAPADNSVATFTRKKDTAAKYTIPNSAQTDQLTSTNNANRDSLQFLDSHMPGEKETAGRKDNQVPALTGDRVDSTPIASGIAVTNAPPASPSLNDQLEKKEELKSKKPLNYEYKSADDLAKSTERSSEPKGEVAIKKSLRPDNSATPADSQRTADYFAKGKAKTADDNDSYFGVTANYRK
ncbi:MAG TPA: hypothetical protein VFI06_05915, partial [Chitinophagaceae bacterium]|nr:hypothetical protein [Chitinophagaceae bacterium]